MSEGGKSIDGNKLEINSELFHKFFDFNRLASSDTN